MFPAPSSRHRNIDATSIQTEGNVKDKDTGISMTRRTLLGAAPFVVAAAGLGAERAGAADMPLKAANADKLPPRAPVKINLPHSGTPSAGPGGPAREANTKNSPNST